MRIALTSLLMLTAALIAACGSAGPAKTASPSALPQDTEAERPPPAAVTVREAPSVRASGGSPPVPETTPVVAAVAFDTALTRAGERLFADAAARLGVSPRPLVIDPLIDANTGGKTAGTAAAAKGLLKLVKAKYPAWRSAPFTRKSLEASPLLVIGTLTPINSQSQAAERADAFRVWLALVDLKTGLIVAKSEDRATAATVDARPTLYDQESPTWHLDATTGGYIGACQAASRPGDPVDPAYLKRLPAAAVVSEAGLAYDARHFEEAYRLYHAAQPLAEPGDLRVLNGLYLSSVRLGRTKEARETFARIVEAGLSANRLPLKLLFAPGTTNFARAGGLAGQYDMWLRTLAADAARREICLNVVGHSSHTGSAALNDALSLKRARVIATRLERDDRRLAGKLSSTGRGYRENLVGLGTDDVRDALDRRVEFRSAECR